MQNHKGKPNLSSFRHPFVEVE